MPAVLRTTGERLISPKINGRDFALAIRPDYVIEFGPTIEACEDRGADDEGG